MTRSREVQAIFEALQHRGPFESLEDANRALTVLTDAYNQRPQAELGGLSPDQMAQVLYGDWIGHGALRVDEKLAIEELRGVAFLADARTVLEYLRDFGPVKETSAHNLPRAVVAALLPRLRMPVQHRVEYGLPGPVNEADVLWLSPLRYVLMFAGLLIRRKGFRITARGRDLLTDDRAGELYGLLFRTLFRTLDLRALGRDDRHPGLQSTVAYSFYKLRERVADWSSWESLAEHAWLPSAKSPPSEWEAANMDFRHYAFRQRVLEPLTQFGLLEERVLPTDVLWKDSVEYRLTPLFRRFLRFEFHRVGAARVDPSLGR